MAKTGFHRYPGEGGLPFGVWWAIGEAIAAALILPALHLMGLI
jgi:hypothetical protein